MTVPKAVVVTRSEPPGGPLIRELQALGLPVLHWPAIAVAPADAADLARTLTRAGSFDWMVLTSGHAVAAVTRALPGAPPGVRIAAVGPATAAALRARGWPVELSGEGPGAEGLLRAFERLGIRGRRILYPASSRALPILSEGLARLGAEVVRIEAYRTVAGAALDAEACRATIAREGVAAVTFASPSAVDELERALGCEHFQHLLNVAAGVAIGPTTARALGARGFPPVVAEPHTLHGLALACDALMRGIQRGSHHASRGYDAALRAEKRIKS